MLEFLYIERGLLRIIILKLFLRCKLPFQLNIWVCYSRKLGPLRPLGVLELRQFSKTEDLFKSICACKNGIN